LASANITRSAAPKPRAKRASDEAARYSVARTPNSFAPCSTATAIASTCGIESSAADVASSAERELCSAVCASSGSMKLIIDGAARGSASEGRATAAAPRRAPAPRGAAKLEAERTSADSNIEGCVVPPLRLARKKPAN
jgi:hypothetical protein